VRSHAESVVLCPGKDHVTGYASFEYEFRSGGLPLRGRGQIAWPELEEDFLDAPGGRGCDALVDGHGLPQAGGAFAGVAAAEVAAADAFQSACFLRRGAEFAGDGQRLRVVVAAWRRAGS
jgi:hypothetical protein